VRRDQYMYRHRWNVYSSNVCLALIDQRCNCLPAIVYVGPTGVQPRRASQGLTRRSSPDWPNKPLTQHWLEYSGDHPRAGPTIWSAVLCSTSQHKTAGSRSALPSLSFPPLLPPFFPTDSFPHFIHFLSPAQLRPLPLHFVLLSHKYHR
jgi:hypothetical protein